MMDPTTTLKDLREWASELVASTDVNVAEFASAFQNLDGWISGGGFLPEQWSDAKKETVMRF